MSVTLAKTAPNAALLFPNGKIAIQVIPNGYDDNHDNRFTAESVITCNRRSDDDSRTESYFIIEDCITTAEDRVSMQQVITLRQLNDGCNHANFTREHMFRLFNETIGYHNQYAYIHHMKSIGRGMMFKPFKEVRMRPVDVIGEPEAVCIRIIEDDFKVGFATFRYSLNEGGFNQLVCTIDYDIFTKYERMCHFINEVVPFAASVANSEVAFKLESNRPASTVS